MAADLDYVHVIQRIGVSVGDQADADSKPDFVPATEGTVTFVPTIAHVSAQVGGRAVSIYNAPIVCNIDSNGYLTYNSEKGVWLVDLGSDKVEPPTPRDKAAYSVQYTGLKFNGQTFKQPAANINPVSGQGDVDITDLTNLPLPSGVSIEYVRSIAQQAVADLQGTPGGVATLDASATLEDSQVPYVPLDTAYTRRHLVGASTGFGGEPHLWDHFQRSDRPLDGDVLPSRHVWGAPNPASFHIRNGRAVMKAVGGSADIIYTVSDAQLDGITVEWVWTASENPSDNVVIGACETGFGSGSIQLATYVVDARDTGIPNGNSVQWQLFCVTDPIIHPYPTLASGTLNFSYNADGETVYRMSMLRVASDTVAAILPDGQMRVVSDPRIATYWSGAAKRTGFQLRRPTWPTLSSSAELTSVATLAIRHTSQTPLASRTYLSDHAEITCDAPEQWTSADIDVRLVCEPDTWSLAMALFIVEDRPGVRAWRIRATGVAGLIMDVTVAGTKHSIGLGSLSAATNAVRVTRTAADGAITAYTSTNRGETWTQSGSGTSPASPPDDHLKRIVVGGTPAAPYIGYLYSATLLDGVGGNTVAHVDMTRPWPGGTDYRDSVGNFWTIENPSVIRRSADVGRGDVLDATGASVGTLTGKVQAYDANGVSLGFVPVYDSIS